MEKNKELTYKEENKLTKRNYLSIIAPIILSLILIAVIAFYVFNVSNPTHKLKRYLEDFNYFCNKSLCTKINDNETFNINYKTGVLIVDGEGYSITIDKYIPKVSIDSRETICNYHSDKYERLTLLDDTFTSDRECLRYIDTINNAITKYKEILNNADVDINEIDK